MRCFVTGATGFVGGHLCERLIQDGHEVRALARSTSKTALLEKVGARIVVGDMDSINVFAAQAQEVDMVFHLAAITKALRRRDFYRVNYMGTRKLVEGLRRGAFRGRVVYLSSLAAAGPARNPNVPRTENDTEAPVSDYGRSKLKAEKAFFKHLPKGSSGVVLRPGAIYGPREHEIYEVLKVMMRLGIAVKIGSGVSVQLTHVEDVVEGLLRAAFRPEASGRTYILSDPGVWSFDQVVELAGESLGKQVRLIPLPLFVGEGLAKVFDIASRIAGKSLSPLTYDKIREMRARYWVGDSSLAEKELEWKPTWDFPRGMQHTIEWYRKEGWL